jgi:DNA-binding response OmpR family regulator
MLSYSGIIPLVIVDIMMPGVNGLDFANQLSIERPQSEILYISGFTGSIAVESIALRKPQSVLPKPFTGQQLVARVQQLLLNWE